MILSNRDLSVADHQEAVLIETVEVASEVEDIDVEAI